MYIYYGAIRYIYDFRKKKLARKKWIDLFECGIQGLRCLNVEDNV